VAALPPSAETIKSIEFKIEEDQLNLRLYCIVLSEEVVILVNGGVKESQLTQDSPECWKQYTFTSNIASQIKKQADAGLKSIKGKMIKRDKKFKLHYEKK
jgi:hypothetical protein